MKAQELFDLYKGNDEFTLMDADVDGAEAYLYAESLNDTARMLLDTDVVAVFNSPYNELRVSIRVYDVLKRNGTEDAIGITDRLFSEANLG